MLECAVQRIGWKICLGCENMCGTVLKAQATMGEAFLTCLEACLWRKSLCLDVQKLSKDVTVPRESAGTKDTVCSVRNEDKLTQKMKTTSIKKWPT